jgi:CheY-like chemotaxis protein
MAPSVLEKIFEPYFTTKIQGKGTGLGLAVVYGIVKEHGGHINVNSKVGKGSSFNIYFPLLENSADTLPPTVEKVEMPWATGHEHILLTDDEEAIILLERKILERLGYRVTVCKDGVDALAVFRENPNSFDLVITDVAMPNMTGDQLARELISIRPDIPIIICTGFSEKIGSAEAKVIGVKEFVMKPIAVLELCKKVRKVLDES